MGKTDVTSQFEKLRQFQETCRFPRTDIARQVPVQASASLRAAVSRADIRYRKYLDEAIRCYEVKAYRGAVLMVWSASIERIYESIENHRNGFQLMEKANLKRFGNSKSYHKICKKDDLLYLSDKNLFLLCEDSGLFNRNARKLLEEKLDTRNRCGHPTGFVVGREESVIFIESLINNIINGAMLNWDKQS